MDRKTRINKLMKNTRKVLMDCCLENGAVVAANSDKPYYPNRCQDYRYVWPVDASFTLLALKELGVHGPQQAYFNWLKHRCEDVMNDGLLFQNYHTHGIKRWANFQPDANANTISLLHDYKDGKPDKQSRELILKLAEGLLRHWNGKTFDMPAQDRWEMRNTYPDLEDNHTYTLAACINGLEKANRINTSSKTQKTIKEMKARLDKAYQRCEEEDRKSFGKYYYFRKHGKLPDPIVDSSVLALVWPFEIVNAGDERMKNTTRVVEEVLVRRGGVMRHECDIYSGWKYHTLDRWEGAGAWPLLNFFMSICQVKQGNIDKARQYYDWVIDKYEEYIPEQHFENEIQQSITPLAWSHAMFVFATRELEKH